MLVNEKVGVTSKSFQPVNSIEVIPPSNPVLAAFSIDPTWLSSFGPL